VELWFGAIAKDDIDLHKCLILIPLFFVDCAVELGVHNARCQHFTKVIHDQGGRNDVLFFNFGFSISNSHICDLRIQRCRKNADGCEYSIHILSTLLCLFQFFQSCCVMMPENTAQSEIHCFNGIDVREKQFDWRLLFIGYVISKNYYRFVYGMPTAHTINVDSRTLIQGFEHIFHHLDAYHLSVIVLLVFLAPH
jgi:hypothetical protein